MKKIADINNILNRINSKITQKLEYVKKDYFKIMRVDNSGEKHLFFSYGTKDELYDALEIVERSVIMATEID